MKTLHKLAAALLLSTITAQLSTVFAQGTAFTYQGRLNNGSAPANGSYDLTFTLYDADQPAGNLIAGPLTNSATAVSNGLFTSTVDFGAGVFTGANYWLEIAVSTSGADSFTTLAPRQQITPTPYAITAGSVASGGLLAGTNSSAVTFDNANNSFAGAFIGDGSNVTNVNATALNGLDSANFWQLGGNSVQAGQFLGSTNNQPVELWVNNQRAVHIESTTNSPNLIGGWSNNFAAPGVVMATIGGGGGQSVVSGSLNTNSVWSSYGTVGGGLGNQAGSTNSDPSFNRGATVGGGGLNTAGGQYSTVPGGYGNFAGGVGSFAAGSYGQATFDGSFVWADHYYSFPVSFGDSGPNQFCILAHGGVQVFGGGLAVTGANSPNYPGTRGVYVEGTDTSGSVYAWNYSTYTPLPLLLNSPGGNVGIGTDSPGALLQVGSATCNGTTWQNASDRALKDHFSAVSPQAMLDKVLALPITEWDYKKDAGAKHVGPMAQDFHAAFGLNGADDKHIATVDESGVALAAIQGLNQKLQEELNRQGAENAELKARLDRLEQLLEQK